jgi:hypothetical protein
MATFKLFNVIRACIYGAVLVFTLICLGVAARFQTALAASDLTRFVPLSIFVCSTTLFAFSILLLFSWILKERNPIITIYELPCLVVAGILWLALGIFLVTSPSQSADVECTSPNVNLAARAEEVNSPFHTETYHAMYRVLNAFALLNASLILIASLGLLFLAFRRHYKGDTHMWRGPVTSCAWFNDYSAKTGSSRKYSTRQRQDTNTILPIAQRHQRQPSRSARQQEKPERTRDARPSHRRDNSSMSNSSTEKFAKGFMTNPNR